MQHLLLTRSPLQCVCFQLEALLYFRHICFKVVWFVKVGVKGVGLTFGDDNIVDKILVTKVGVEWPIF